MPLAARAFLTVLPMVIWGAPTDGALVPDPAGEHHTRRPCHGHSSHMSYPSKQSCAVVVFERAYAEALQQLLGADAVAEDLAHRDFAHRADALVVEDFETLKLFLPEVPTLAAVKKDAEAQRDEDQTFVLLCREAALEEAVLQCTKSAAGLGYASAHIRATGERVVDEASEIDELRAEGDESVAIDGEVSLITVAVGLALCWEVDSFRTFQLNVYYLVGSHPKSSKLH